MTNTTTYGQVPAIQRYTKKPVTIEAIQWTGKNLREVITFTDGPPDTRSHHAGMAWEAYTDLVARDGLMIYTLEDGPDRRAKHFADIGDWIIRGVKGEYYPCKPDIFEATYNPEAALRTQEPSPSGEESKPHGWLYDWTHSSATGKPDTTYTGFTKDEAHARKHDNCTAVFTTPQPSAAQAAGTAEVVECGNLYAKVKLRGDAFGSTNVGDVFYSAPQPSPHGTGRQRAGGCCAVSLAA